MDARRGAGVRSHAHVGVQVGHVAAVDQRRDVAQRAAARVVRAREGVHGPTIGRPIVRYTHEGLAAEFPGYRIVSTSGEDHETPWGTTQQFTAVLLQRPA